jgi:hypothetical protein
MSRFRRILLVTLIIVVILLAALQVVRRYWLSGRASQAAAIRLEQAYGARVRVGPVDIGLHGSSVHDLRLYEEGAPPDAAPWAVIREADADLSLANLLRGEMTPRTLAFRDADVTLRFDKDGHLLTRLPRTKSGAQALPEIIVADSKLTLRQEGRPEWVLSGIALDVRREGDDLNAQGTIHDPTWGNWTLGAKLNPATTAAMASLKTPHAVVTQAMLSSLPFVPESVWREVHADGETSADITFVSLAHERGLRYRIVLQPEHTTVTVPSISLTAVDARGKVIIDNGLVQLRDVVGQAANGRLYVSGDLDFRGPQSRLAFKARSEGLRVEKLASNWGLPRQVEGRLFGQADLQITIKNDRAQTTGSGEGTIRDARIAGQSAEPIRLKLGADGAGFHFSSLPAPSEQRALTVLTARPAPRRPRRSPAAIDLFTDQRGAAAQPERRPAAPPKPPAPEVLSVHLGMKEADLATLLKGFGIMLPIEIAGRISLEVDAAVPVNSPKDLKDYRLDGTATFSRLNVGGLELVQVQTKLRYRDGVLLLDNLSGRLPRSRPGGTAGAIQGTVRAQIAPRGDLTADLSLRDVAINRPLGLVVASAFLVRGAVSGSVTATVPVDRAGDASAWHASGGVKAASFQIYTFAVRDVTASLNLERGILTVARVRGNLEGAPVAASCQVRVANTFAYEATVSVGPGESRRFLAAWPRSPIRVEGQAQAEGSLKGTLRPFAFSGSGNARGSNLKTQDLRWDDVQLSWALERDRIVIPIASGHLYGGSASGDATVPLRQTGAGQANLHFQNVDVGKLVVDAHLLPFPIGGRANANVRMSLPAAGPRGQRIVTARARLRAPRLGVRGLSAEGMAGSVDYGTQRLEYHLAGRTLGGSLQLDGQMPRQSGSDSKSAPAGEGKFTLRGALLSRLAPSLGVGAPLDALRGRVGITVDYRFDAEGRLAGKGSVQVARLRWNGTELAPYVRAEIELSGTELRVQRLTSPFGGGSIRGRLGMRLEGTRSGEFVLNLRNVEVSGLLAPWPELASRAEGMIDGTIRGHLDGEWSGTGTLLFPKGKVQDSDIADLRLPLSFSWTPGSHGQVELRDCTGQVAGGHLTATARYAWGGESRLDAQGQFSRVDLQSLLRQTSAAAHVPNGRISGRFQLDGGSIQSVNDLTGSIDATLGQTQAFQLPVFQQVLRFLTPTISPNMSFQTGRLRARLARGIVRMQELSLEGDFVRLFSDGSVRLNGALALDVVASVGRIGPSPLALRALGPTPPVVGSMPAALLLQLSNYLSSRVVRLHVGGAISNPSVQLQPGLILTEEAIIFFLNRANVPTP